MERKLGFGNSGELEAIGEQNLWDVLLQNEDITICWQDSQPLTEDMVQVGENPHAQVRYPWNPADPASEAFFTDSDIPSIFADWQEEEIAERSQSFFNRLEQVWAPISLQSRLAERFSTRIPHSLLAAIAQQAQAALSNTQKALNTSLSVADQLSEQLVQCVQGIIPTLAAEDLYVLARPLAYQMRNGGLQNAIDTTLAQVPQTDWEQLSEMQRARLSLAIARFAIHELQASQDD
ncbi:hypothetical protein [Leptodesmis sp.]|uniref:hypothetical protein n=1 Tax=Leptodesmis sp. TaxID=3100501 RepID=UPI00405352F9